MPCYPEVKIILACPVRILLIQMPAQGIINDVFPYPVERIFVPDNMFIVIALPDRLSSSSP